MAGKEGAFSTWAFFKKRLLIPAKIRGPSGSSVIGIVPTNAYPCHAAQASNEHVVTGANVDPIYNQYMASGVVPESKHNQHRVQRQGETEDAISAWTSRRTVEDSEIINAVNLAQVLVGRVVSLKEVVIIMSEGL